MTQERENRPTANQAAQVNLEDKPKSTQLTDKHARMLAASGITAELIAARGYRSIRDPRDLEQMHPQVAKAGRRTPGLLVPMRRVDGSQWGYQYRPDSPRERNGKLVKYETPTKQRNGIDVPPIVGPQLADPTIALWITEGVKKADCGAANGLCVVALPGVWSWIGKNTQGGTTALADFRDIAFNDRRVILAFDGDVARKQSVRQALRALADYLSNKGAQVEYAHLPDTDDKTGLDDFLAEHPVEELWRLVSPSMPPMHELAGSQGSQGSYLNCDPTPVAHTTSTTDTKPISLAEAHTVFRRWLGTAYDLDTLDATLASAAVEQLDGDPVWLLIVSGSGNAKTETVQSLQSIGAEVVSQISSVGALLSATPKREQAKDATGGLLPKIGPRGVLVIKDVTTILSMNRDARAEILAALREVYDGSWSRDVGTDGGKTLSWSGRIVVVGAVTTAWDRAHTVISSMGDRFVLIRADSTTGRVAAGRQAIGNTGDEKEMRAELSRAVSGVLAGVQNHATKPNEAEVETLLRAADLVTLARTGVEYDYRGDVIDAHAPEMPTRFAKQLTQLLRGGVAIGMERAAALALAIRCARDSMPPLRLEIIDYLAEHPHRSTADVRKAISKPRNTVDRQLQALHMLGVLECDEQETRWAGKDVTLLFYSLADGIDPEALKVPKTIPDLLVVPSSSLEESDSEEGNNVALRMGANKSGTESTCADIADDPDPQPLTKPVTFACIDCGNQAMPGPDRTTRCDRCHRNHARVSA